MKKMLLLAASALLLTTMMPQDADAQMRRGVGRVGGPRVGMVRPGFRPGYRPGYAYRRGGYGWGPAVGLGVLGAAALGAAVATPYYGGYADPCLRRQQVVDQWGNAYWQTVPVC
jgi:hypothetical protein